MDGVLNKKNYIYISCVITPITIPKRSSQPSRQQYFLFFNVNQQPFNEKLIRIFLFSH